MPTQNVIHSYPHIIVRNCYSQNLNKRTNSLKKPSSFWSKKQKNSKTQCNLLQLQLGETLLDLIPSDTLRDSTKRLFLMTFSSTPQKLISWLWSLGREETASERNILSFSITWNPKIQQAFPGHIRRLKSCSWGDRSSTCFRIPLD